MMSLILAAAVAAAPLAPGKPLTPERVFSSPALSGPAARGVDVSPDGAWLTYLKPEPQNHDKLDLWAAPVAGGEPRLLVSGEKVEPPEKTLTEAEKSRRERQRLASVSGVVEYHWDEEGKRILIPAGGDLYSADAATGQVTRLATGGIIDPKASRHGRYVAFVRDQNLFLVDLASGQERALTTEGKGSISYGMAEFVAQEEMDRYTGYWWSPDEKAIAYARVDESTVDLVPRLEIGVDGAAHVVQQRYPKAGRPNARVDLFVQGLAPGAKPVQVDLGPNADIYVARVAWSEDGRDLYVERESRDQTVLDLLRADPATGKTTVLIHEVHTPWIDLNDDFYALKDGTFIWGSERSGANHLYLYDRQGRLIRPITHGSWLVAGTGSGAGVHAPGVVGVDETKGLVYFMASKDTPIERQLYAVSYRAPGEPRPVTSGHGWWTAVMPKSAKAFVGYYSDSTTPPQTALYAPDGKRLRWVEENRLDEAHPFHPYAARYPAPEFGILKSADGQDLHYILQKPVGFDPARRYPAIVEVYGGPGVQSVQRAWRNPEEKLYLEAGYVLFQLDNRGSANRDVRFRSAINRRMGTPEVDDQLVGIDHLRTLPFVDPARIGVTGWSYGGYMTLRLLTDPRTHLKAGAAGAPPTDWREYDTHYTERYMGMPQTEGPAYDASAVLPRLDKLSGRLLLMQGMADDNVQLSNSIAVMGKLQARSVPFDLMVFPGQRHGISGDPRRLQLWRTYLQFFARELGGAEPPNAPE